MQSRKPVGRRYLFNLIMAACVVLFSLMSIFGFIAIQNKNQFIGTQYNGVTWSAASLEIEYLQFLHEIEEFLHERSDKESMLLQFDILWSRVPIMIDGTEVDVLQDLPGYAEKLSAIEQVLASVDPVIQN
ncbi:MAG: hypothetical protein OER96_08775 [Gammaproteobacteria bacterium]|nr:hypothetical protein [Gammaproteobacteria bacterium]